MSNSTSYLALLGAMGLFAGASAAHAADLGGNCCADLEERIAELEATTARKGNRKVSLEVSGQVHEAIMFWDDGEERNAYVVTNDNARTRFRFTGKAKITDDWSAGYRLEIGVRSVNSKRVDQLSDDSGPDDTGLDIRYSEWHLESKTLGRVSVGHTEMATQSITENSLAATKDISKYSDVEDSGLGMRLRASGDGLSSITWRRLISDSGSQPGEGDRQEAVRYDTPTFAGFKASAAWGEDDFWDVALRYSGEFGGFKVAAGIGYGVGNEGAGGSDRGFDCLAVDGSVANIIVGNKDADCRQVGGSISVMHVESGLFASFAAGSQTDELIDKTDFFAGTGADDESTFWAVQGGIEQKWNPLGKTTLYGEYYKNEGGANARRLIGAADAINPFPGVASRIFSTELEMFGGGVIQAIDAAAMHIYISYRHYEADVIAMRGDEGVDLLGSVPLDDLDIVMTGALIKF